MFPGSSPLTRGKPSTCGRLGGPFGLIPAHAGKTVTEQIHLLNKGAHPRSRGENGQLKKYFYQMMGSSPLTRGKLNTMMHYGWVERLIPAHAGKTATRKEHRNAHQAHPRSRGENSRLACR